MPDFATARIASALLPSSPGRSLISARSHHLVVDSPPPLGGPNEELNPLDLLLGALATCAAFVAETAAREADIQLDAAHAQVEADFDPAAVRGSGDDARLQAIRLSVTLEGPSRGEAERLVEALRTRCPVFTTLNAAVPIQVDLHVGAATATSS